MCGIVGYVGDRQASPIIIEGLKRLEYRGYDSAGICVRADSGGLELVRSAGKIASLEEKLRAGSPRGTAAVAHTRWATHGRPSEENAHPHRDCSGRLVVVHNGIIENYRALRDELAAKGHRFASETDTEVLPHLVEEKLRNLSAGRGALGGDLKEALLFEAVRLALREVRGAYAIAVLWADAPGTLLAAKSASPLVVGLGDGETFVASDVPAFLEHTRKAVFLEDGELAVLGRERRSFFNLDGRRLEKAAAQIQWDRTMAEKGGYKHFMLKEIYEQPRAVEDTLRGRLYPLKDGGLARELGLDDKALRAFSQVRFVACGTAYHAGLIGKYVIERYAGIPCEAELASEFRYRHPLLTPDTLIVAISQSGETADTLAAVKLAKAAGAKVLSICNVVGSALTRASDFNFYTRCGPEIGVASTKAFVGQLAALNVVALHMAAGLGRLSDDEARAWADAMLRLPNALREVLALEPAIADLARRFSKKEHFLYIGRNLDYPIALEGALKLKELSYIHAEGYAAGEMKHGPIALIDSQMPVLAIATASHVAEKIVSNMEEAKARGATVIALCTKGDEDVRRSAEHVIEVPPVPEFLAPIVNVVPLQLLAYHVADLRGCDVDQPRNLAKSVTVE